MESNPTMPSSQPPVDAPHPTDTPLSVLDTTASPTPLSACSEDGRIHEPAAPGAPTWVLPPQSAEELRRHEAGFSAFDFASYASRLAPNHRDSTVSGLTLTGAPFASASDLEKGGREGVDKPRPAHVRHESVASVASYSSSWTDLTVTVPAPRQAKLVRNARHKGFTVYRRLFSVVFFANLAALLALLITRARSSKTLPQSEAATAAAANIALAVWIRQDYVVNALFRVFWAVPHSAPLWLRARVAKVYEHGGVHSGAGAAGTMWFVLFTVLQTRAFVLAGHTGTAVLAIAYVLLALLLCILIFAYPRLRFTSHNTFEASHRFAGWTAVALFWALFILLARSIASTSHRRLSAVLVREPTFWLLVFITAHIILPWLRLRKWTFTPTVLSPHALRLDFATPLPPLSGLAISSSPLREWHPFATFPDPVGGGGSMIVSNAGDWTASQIRDPKRAYWVKGLPKTGVLSMAFCFRSVVVVTTGSGIGPCLSFLREPRRKTACRVFWSTPRPLETYGTDVCESVRKADEQAVVVDTKVSGRPDMVAVTWALFTESGAEAVFVISNPRVTRKVVMPTTRDELSARKAAVPPLKTERDVQGFSLAVRTARDAQGFSLRLLTNKATSFAACGVRPAHVDGWDEKVARSGSGLEEGGAGRSFKLEARGLNGYQGRDDEPGAWRERSRKTKHVQVLATRTSPRCWPAMLATRSRCAHGAVIVKSGTLLTDGPDPASSGPTPDSARPHPRTRMRHFREPCSVPEAHAPRFVRRCGAADRGPIEGTYRGGEGTCREREGLRSNRGGRRPGFSTSCRHRGCVAGVPVTKWGRVKAALVGAANPYRMEAFKRRIKFVDRRLVWKPGKGKANGPNAVQTAGGKKASGLTEVQTADENKASGLAAVQKVDMDKETCKGDYARPEYVEVADSQLVVEEELAGHSCPSRPKIIASKEKRGEGGEVNIEFPNLPRFVP
ncbi:hypothetical protein EJ06DRAFT_525117 [Trichodelitschia bisporula]|uniref:Integral membrane protein TmpA n=1 Tax=Trichodelitschia bisporula TaxID=703511 RepID=A0A6G1HIP6_9PEZI|nr:hypothetical protein EJ06DRAFT_525117 [Trichodelitschia bisporula]